MMFAFVFLLILQCLEAQNLEKGVIKFKSSIALSPNAKSEFIQFLDSAFIKTIEMVTLDGMPKEEIDALTKEFEVGKQETAKNFEKDFLEKNKASPSYRILFSQEEVLREKFDFENNKVKHEKIYADGRIVSYDFWTNKDKITYLSETNLHVIPSPISIEVDKNDRKVILNHNCYKIKVTEQLPFNDLEDEEQQKMEQILKGYNIYEMYVAEDIKLFAHAIMDNANPLGAYFPLEIVEYMNFVPSVKTITIATSIE